MLHDTQKNLSVSELNTAIENLSKFDFVKLKKIAKLASNLCGLSAEDLLHEAFSRSLLGTRKCPRDVDIIRFLAETMRSIASSDAKSFSRHPEVSLQTPIAGGDSDYQENLADKKQPTTEATAIARLDLAKIQSAIPKLFKSDPEAIQYLAMGIADGMNAEELQELSGLQGKAYKSARRLFRRRIEKAFPGGMENG